MTNDRILMRTSTPRFRPVGREALIQQFAEALYQTYLALWDAQQSTLIELGKTPSDRFTLSCELARSLYASGIQGFPSAHVQKLVSEGELQALLYILLCGTTHTSFLRDAMERLLSSHVRAFAEPSPHTHGDQAFRKEYYGTFIGNNNKTAQSDHHPVSTVPSRVRSGRRNAGQGRTARSTGRTGWDHDRPVSELLP